MSTRIEVDLLGEMKIDDSKYYGVHTQFYEKFYILILLFLLVALFAPLITPYDPLAVNLDHIKKAPNAQHLLGTDTIGRDVLSRIIYGTRISLFVGISATLLSLGFGAWWTLRWSLIELKPTN